MTPTLANVASSASAVTLLAANHMVGRGPADDPALVPNHLTDIKQRLDVIRQTLEQLAAWLRSRPVLRF